MSDGGLRGSLERCDDCFVALDVIWNPASAERPSWPLRSESWVWLPKLQKAARAYDDVFTVPSAMKIHWHVSFAGVMRVFVIWSLATTKSPSELAASK